MGAPTTSLGAPGSASNHSKEVREKRHRLGNIAGASGNCSYYLSFNDF